MLVTFQKTNGQTVAINPEFVMMVEDVKGGTDIVLSDGGTTRVTESYLNVVGIIQAQLRN